MAISPLSSSVDLNVQAKQARNTAQNANTENKTSSVGIQSQLKSQLNSQILEASLSVSIKSGDNSLALFYRTAISNIGETVESAIGKVPGQDEAANQPDNSPEATAGRILSFATGFFEAYAKQHPGEDPDEVAKNFVNLVQKGFEKGFNEAKDVLNALGKLNGSDTEKGINQTYDLVMKGFEDFLSSKLKPKDEAPPISPTGQVNPDAKIV